MLFVVATLAGEAIYIKLEWLVDEIAENWRSASWFVTLSIAISVLDAGIVWALSRNNILVFPLTLILGQGFDLPFIDWITVFVQAIVTLLASCLAVTAVAAAVLSRIPNKPDWLTQHAVTPGCTDSSGNLRNHSTHPRAFNPGGLVSAPKHSFAFNRQGIAT
ncbi:hypothetical protein ACFOWY_16235 [Lysinibacter cavernae]